MILDYSVQLQEFIYIVSGSFGLTQTGVCGKNRSLCSGLKYFYEKFTNVGGCACVYKDESVF